MQRLFSMFPTGGPGIALLLLRLSVAGSLTLDVNGAGRVVPPWVALVMALLLSAGWLTPILAVLATILLAAHAMRAADTAAIFAVFAIPAAALSLLGPGAYSLDARRFGRRLVVTPARPAGDERANPPIV